MNSITFTYQFVVRNKKDIPMTLSEFEDIMYEAFGKRGYTWDKVVSYDNRWVIILERVGKK